MRETLSCVQRSLDGMRDKYRVVFVLRYVDGMDLKDISLGLGISLATVKRYLAKALVYVQKSVSQQERRARVRLAPPAASRLFGGGR
jgi:RNA polymerase sigma-70 factor (ECF subfamily)